VKIVPPADDRLFAESVEHFLDLLGQRSPTPGGGTAAAAAGALACAQAKMVAAYCRRKDEPATQAEARFETLGHMLRRLADEDAAAYATLSGAKPKGGGQNSLYQQALVTAAFVPIEIAAAATNALAAMDEMAGQVNKYMVSDLGVAAALARAAVSAANLTARINLREISDAEHRAALVSQVETLVSRAGKLADGIENHLAGQL
jgi:formiminotetrahydrofolate cyclodeaminase